MSTTTTSRSTSPARARRLALGAVAAALFITALDTYVVVTLLPRIMFDLGVPVDRAEQASPVITGFLAGYIVAMPIIGAASDVYGRKRVFLTALAAFLLGSIVTATAGPFGFDATAGNVGWLVAGRVLQGLGGGATVPVAMAMAADFYPAGRRAVPVGVLSALQETGSVLGPLYGAALAGLIGWRGVFLANLVLAAMVAIGFWLAVRALGAPRAVLSRAADARRVDWVGGAMLGTALGLGVLALYPDDPAHRATGALLLPLGALALALLGGYGCWQARRPEALLPRKMLRDAGLLGAALTNLLVGTVLMVALVDIPVLARAAYGFDELGSALLLARFMLAIPVGAVIGGVVASRLGNRTTAATGMAVAAAAFLQMSTWGAGAMSQKVLGLPSVTLTLAMGGFAFGLVIAPVAAATLDRVRASEHGLASSLVVLSRTFGMLLGLCALTGFGLHRFYELMRSAPPPAVTDPNALSLLERQVTVALLQEYHDIFRITAVVCVVATGVALVSLGAARRPVAETAAG